MSALAVSRLWLRSMLPNQPPRCPALPHCHLALDGTALARRDRTEHYRLHWDGSKISGTPRSIGLTSAGWSAIWKIRPLVCWSEWPRRFVARSWTCLFPQAVAVCQLSSQEGSHEPRCIRDGVGAGRMRPKGSDAFAMKREGGQAAQPTPGRG